MMLMIKTLHILFRLLEIHLDSATINWFNGIKLIDRMEKRSPQIMPSS